jgi:hypothetical protein
MKKVVHGLRLMVAVLLLILAAFGVGIGQVFYARERYLDKETKIERIEKKDDEENEDIKRE